MSIVALNSYNEYFKKPSSYFDDFEQVNDENKNFEELIAYYKGPNQSELKAVELVCESVNVERIKVRGAILNRRRALEQKHIYVLHGQSTKNIFDSNLEKWKAETAITSSLDKIILNKHYQRIIGLGVDAVPLILKEYISGSGPWHNALEAITGENPVTKECIGRARKIKEAWIEWAKEKGYL